MENICSTVGIFLLRAIRIHVNMNVKLSDIMGEYRKFPLAVSSHLTLVTTLELATFFLFWVSGRC